MINDREHDTVDRQEHHTDGTLHMIGNVQGQTLHIIRNVQWTDITHHRDCTGDRQFTVLVLYTNNF